MVEVRVGGNEGEDDGVLSLDLWGVIFGPAEEGGVTQLPLRPGDELGVDFDGDGSWIPILPSDGDTLVFRTEDHGVYLADTPVVLVLDDSVGWDWLGGATPEEKASLRVLAIEDDLPPEHLSLLEDLATHNRTPALATDGEEPLIRTILGLFDPAALTTFDNPVSAESAALLSHETELRKLTFSGNDVTEVGFLKGIPNLEELFISDFDPEETGPLPDSLPNLRSIFLIDPDFLDLDFLGIQPDLEELAILGCSGSDPMNIDAISRFPDLSLVAIRDCEVKDLSRLDQLEDLQWLALPWGTTQEEMEHIVATHPILSVLELFASEDLVDLTPLTDLKELNALILGSSAPPDPLFEMDHLEYLAVVVEESGHASFEENSVLRLQAELPGTIVARAAPFCLGSGFILLLIPLVGLAWLTVGRRSRTRNPVSQHG